LALASPILLPKMPRRNRVFKENRSRAEDLNRQRMDGAHALDFPELEFLELTALVDEKTANGFLGDPGVSYLIRMNLGELLFDVGFGPDSPTLSHNLSRSLRRAGVGGPNPRQGSGRDHRLRASDG
jgi:7,8-dihydropterin-6-yl-methyl-4-(beta-D-ribofuranosyl)aminobenzene 5'-phosphate synthase